MTEIVRTEQLRKSFRARGRAVEAVRGLDLGVRQGEVFAFLGPNGAGKTTTLRMLTTLMPIGAGRAVVAGADVAAEPALVRRRIGYVGQDGGADLPATGRENLLLQGRLYGASRSGASRRAGELIDLLALGDFADRRVRTYSGGQRRRLEVALGLMHSPRLLFLDEPTVGLDPQNRANLWDRLRSLRSAGTTIFLTTHYLEEADELADRVAIIDHGRIVAEGTPRQLKDALGGDTIRLVPTVPAERAPAGGPDSLGGDGLRDRLAGLPFVVEARLDDEALTLTVANGTRALPPLLDALAGLGVELEGLTLTQPSLDDVFLARTGRALRDAGPGNGTAGNENGTEDEEAAA
ncbi:MAG TPA: ATP-binding cassette domain-containing protein [Trebonia sp.]|jgi:ABC-2 type transport system ATP-binding protein